MLVGLYIFLSKSPNPILSLQYIALEMCSPFWQLCIVIYLFFVVVYVFMFVILLLLQLVFVILLFQFFLSRCYCSFESAVWTECIQQKSWNVYTISSVYTPIYTPICKAKIKSQVWCCQKSCKANCISGSDHKDPVILMIIIIFVLTEQILLHISSIL